ncbi:hypothetical protein D3C77_714100 [compost metagenome]
MRIRNNEDLSLLFLKNNARTERRTLWIPTPQLVMVQNTNDRRADFSSGCTNPIEWIRVPAVKGSATRTESGCGGWETCNKAEQQHSDNCAEHG